MADLRLSLNEPLLSFVPRWLMSAANMSGRYLTPDSVRQRDKAELPVSGRSRRPAIDPLRSLGLLRLTSASQRLEALSDR